ncbi:hypothetical protein [Priestia megaterium]|uniref:hypothetical protein n=1 Tax=Priestia megaterium TaxID=1404 RepID=UPI002E1FFA9F|nr:hypothetical protein [Priestia megaterium]
MQFLDVFNQIVTLIEGINKLSELIDADKLPPWMFLVGLNLNYCPQKEEEHKDQEENKQKKEPS